MPLLARVIYFQPFRVDRWPLFAGLLAALLVAGYLFPAPGWRLAGIWRRALGPAARSMALAMAVCALPAIFAGAALLAFHGFPLARVHDEFSYLLAADTFAHGRLANPQHPLWMFFETFHVNQTPTYASMYPPAQGLVLAFGQVVLGHPWFGVWLSVALLNALVCWALAGWMPRIWALTAGIAAASMVSWSYWLASYWGGAVAAAGGALVIGAWPRLVHRTRTRDAVLFALGIVILANSRPYEGAALSLIAVAAVARRADLRKMIVPAGAILLAGGAWMAYYNWRVTGEALLLPYVLNARTYLAHPLFLWQPEPPQPFYRHEAMRQLYSGYQVRRFSMEFIRTNLEPTMNFYMGSLLFLVPPALPWILHSRRFRGLFLATAGVGIAVALSVWVRPHYLAPALAGLVGVRLQALRWLAALRVRGRRCGALAAYALVLLWLCAQWMGGLTFLQAQPSTDWPAVRERIAGRLKADGGQHLVFVRYGADHNRDDEWVYNGADLIEVPVLWARDMGTEQDRLLVRYYGARRAWLLDADSATLSPYPGAGGQ